MPITLHTKNGQQILIEDAPFASGGEGAIHKVISSNFQGCCVKMYFQQHRNKQKEQKIDYMIKNPPPNLQSNTYRICWPKELVYQNNQFIGFVMTLAFNGSQELYKLVLPKLKQKDFKTDFNTWQAKYDRTQQSGIISRLKLCVNIAISVHTVHSYQKYVFVDMKPINFLMTLDGNISIIDTDSMQISNGNQVLFPAQVATPEYVPVEGNNLNPSEDFIPETWDRFSMAIIFYELLFGLHPYVASFKGPYKDTDAINLKIESGLFVHGSKKTYILVLPSLHGNFNIIPQSFKDLFLKAFDDGHNNPNLRPSAENWGQILYTELSKAQPQVQGLIQKLGLDQETGENPNYTETINGVSFDMIWVEGSDNFLFQGKKKIRLDGFYVAKFETTQALYQAIIGTNPAGFKGDNKPVEQVSWFDAVAFTEKLSDLTGKKYTLPSEAQWEYAAKGGRLSKGYKYAGSNTIDEVACYDKNSSNKDRGDADYGTHNVGRYKPNELGIYDMSGNVWEWCLDEYKGDVLSTIPDNFLNPLYVGNGVIDSKSFNVKNRARNDRSFACLRGGCWNYSNDYCAVAVRIYSNAWDFENFIGFRLFRTP